MEETKVDSVNRCYEALLDLKCIFPSWSEVQDNFHYHWKEILNSSIKFEESDNKVLESYLSILEPILDYKTGGVESKTALKIVKSLDQYRKQYDEEFEHYVLEEVLNLDVPSIKSPPKAPRGPTPRKRTALIQAQNEQEDNGSAHSYGTRHAKVVVPEGNGKRPRRSRSRVNAMGQHLKKGISSDYVWEFTDNDLRDDYY